MNSKPIALLAAFAVLSTQATQAREDQAILKQRRAELAWSELAAILTEKKISTKLPDGIKLQGEVLSVRPDALVMDVHKTSNRKEYPKGQAEIPRASITEVRVIRDRGPMKAVGGVLGGFGGSAFTTAISIAADSAVVAVTGMLLFVPLGIVGGYYLGKAADRRNTTISIRPDVEPVASTAKGEAQ